ncbi:MAG TPA: NAD-glutamate dehydrogenase [Pseudonocardiaceae bacterium]
MTTTAPPFVKRGNQPSDVQDDLLRRATEQAPELAELIRLYFRHVPAEEMLDDLPDDVVGVVRAHQELAEQRPAGRPTIAVLNPSRAEHGWACPKTVIQIVTDDMPYLVDSVVAELRRAEITVYRVVHPIVVVRRSLTGDLLDVLPDADPAGPPQDALAESWMYLEVSRIADAELAKQVQQRLVTVLNDVREVVEDATKMSTQVRQIARGLRDDPPAGLPEEEVRGGAAFLDWLANGNFTFLGYREYQVVGADEPGEETGLRAVLASGLGVLRKDSLSPRGFGGHGPHAEQALSKELLVLTLAGTHSTVVRPVHPYYVGVKTFDEHGQVSGEHRFLGMLTSSALHENVLDIPVINRRVLGVIQRAGFPLDSYSGQRMLDVIQNYPRAELFSTDSDTLYNTVTGVLSLAERRRLRLFLRRDQYGRFYSALVYLPRERWTTTARLRMQDELMAELGGTDVEYNARVGESPLARVYFMVHTDPAAPLDREPDLARLQDALTQAMRTWDDRLAEAVLGASPDDVDAATELVERYAAGIPESYKESYTGGEALHDLRRLEALVAPEGLDMAFYTQPGAEDGELRFKLYLMRGGVTLSQVLPVLQTMGVEVVDERPYHLTRQDGAQFWIYDFGLRVDPAVLKAVPEDRREEFGTNFHEAFRAAWQNEAEVDRFNALVLRAMLTWRQAMVLRAYAKYLRQAGFPYSQDLVEDVLLAHTHIASALVELFEARFDLDTTDHERAERVDRLTAEIGKLIDEVTGLDSDRILRGYLTLVNATLRCTYSVGTGDYLAFKLDPQAIPDLPRPRPRFEIFVYSPRVEGVHLRFGPVARGGLRWSDRREDFRTEILGLVKAQAVKNSVIVPVGAKGGFVVKRPPAPTGDPGRDREALMAEGIACYRMFIGALLDLTDNLVAGRVVPAERVVRHDGDDAYLVVAADKGTATFSDIANEVAVSRGFWLGDAFASGGSAGYDHKAMGITARGAWESVRRHFRELGVDTQTDEFTVVGIGDMSGDVFGNGMLLSEHIRLVAAFDHRHVFLDPDPDAAASFAERARLFALPRSSWEDYDRSLIGEGGGVYPRSAKSIPITPQVRAALGLPDDVVKLSPPDLLRAVLLAPVDLLWNGGIGTYVKATGETHADVGDKANDAIRVNGAELRVKVIGEGGNLGLTQRGRIEFARSGGKVNTDAIDNSAGVDCSDHEVNIKILLDRLVADGTLPAEQRNPLLAEMTDEVAGLVLADNYAQNQMLGIGRAHAPDMLSVHSRLVDHLAATRGLDRTLDVLPTREQFEALEQAQQGLSSPELATLLAHVKLALKADLLDSDLPDTDVFAGKLPGYFPTPLRERYREAIGAHPLRREIITTVAVNEVVDGGGVTFAYRLQEELSVAPTDAVLAFATATGVFDLGGLWEQVSALDNVLPTGVQDGLMLESRRLLDRAARWFLSNRPQPLRVGEEIARFAPVVRELVPVLPGLLRGQEAAAMSAQSEILLARGVPARLATRVGGLLFTFGLLDVAEVAAAASEQGEPRTPLEAAELYYALSEHLRMDRLLTAVTLLERGNRWHSLARLALRDDLYGSLRAITLDVLRTAEAGTSAAERIAAWEQANVARLDRARVALTDLAQADTLDLASLSVAARQIRTMAG